MSEARGSSGLFWGVLLVGVVTWALIRDPKPPRVVATPQAAVAVSAPAPVATPAPTPPDPSKALRLARAFESHGLRTPTDRPAAYELARRALRVIPSAAPEATTAAKLLREVEARMLLPAFVRAPPASQADLEELLGRLEERGSARTLAIRPRGVAPVPGAPATARARPATPPHAVGQEDVVEAAPPETVAELPPVPIERNPYPRVLPPLDGYGAISSETGLPKTTYVRPYTRKDGTQVRGHYRSR